MDPKLLLVLIVLISVFILFNFWNRNKNKNVQEGFASNLLNYPTDIVNPDAPLYEPDKWNSNSCIKAAHNCYSYMLNLIYPDLTNLCEKGEKIINPQPGHYCGIVKRVYKPETTCNNLTKRVLCDNPSIIMSDRDSKCPAGFYKGALAVNPGVTYHFYRQNRNGLWSHKDGGRPVTNVDASGNIIYDPQTSDRMYPGKRKYTDFCGYFCIPKNDENKNMCRRKKGVCIYNAPEDQQQIQEQL